MTATSIHHLRADGVSFVLDAGTSVPRVLHWGADLGDLDPAALAALAETGWPANPSLAPRGKVLSVLPTEHETYAARLGIEGHRAGLATAPRFATESVERDGDAVRIALRDGDAGLRVELRYALSPEGVLRAAATVENTAGADAAPYDVAELTLVMPLPAYAVEIGDYAGLWSHERAPQRIPVVVGEHHRRTRRGKPGGDSPLLTQVGTAGFRHRAGEVFAMHVAFSGDTVWYVGKLPEGAGAHAATLGGGEALHPGEIRLGAGETYTTPDVLFVWSGRGTDGLSDRLHRMLRARPGHPSSPRPLLLNNWEATYFDHDMGRLGALVDLAAEVGAERFVLDDGWFGGRRDDHAGLGDWTVSPDAWPDGLRPLVDRVRSHGLQFGLWFEPEMVNLDSDMAREHPDWILGPVGAPGPEFRFQHVVDLTNPDAWTYLFEAISALVAEHDIDYLKWDHNRELFEALSRGRQAVHGQALALYALLDALRERFPGLEIESCASGGLRIDLGILERTDRVWASDCNDPVEREQIQRGTSALIPLELIGAHVGAARSHTTDRVTDQSYRMATALFGHAGIEWDITRCTPEELALLRSWTALYRELRPLLHTGELVHADLDDPAVQLLGVVAHDRAHAAYAWSRIRTSPTWNSGRVRFPGLDPARAYRVRLRDELGHAARRGDDPAWLLEGPSVIAGSVLTGAGVPLPNLQPQQAVVLELTAD